MRIVALVVAVGTAVLLFTRAYDGVTAVNAQTTRRAVVAASDANATYSCIGTEARDEVPQGSSVFFAVPTSVLPGAALVEPMLGWATIESDASKAAYVVSIRDLSATRLGGVRTPRSCGRFLVTASHGGSPK